MMIVLLVALAGTTLTYGVTSQVLKTFGTFDSPRFIAAIVALLSGLSLLSLGEGVVTLILIPYAALGLSLPFLLLLKWLRGSDAWRELQRLLAESRHCTATSKDIAPLDRRAAEKRSLEATESGSTPATSLRRDRP